jgi:hypothetical protein
VDRLARRRKQHIEGGLFTANREQANEWYSCAFGTDQLAPLIKLSIVDFTVPQRLIATEEVFPPHTVRLCADLAAEEVIHILSTRVARGWSIAQRLLLYSVHQRRS